MNTKKTAVMATLKLHLVHNPFMKSLSILVAGTAMSNLLLLLTTPIVTRLYTPEQYGVFSLYLSILYSISVIASLMYDQAVPLPKEDQDGWDTLILSLLLVILMSGVVLVLTLTLPFGAWMNAPELSCYGWLLVFSMLGIGCFQALNAWCIRTEQYPAISKAKVSMNSGQTGSQIVLGLVHTGVLGLLAGEIIGRFSGCVMFISSLVKKKPAIRLLNLPGIRKTFIRYRSFPIWSSWSALINVTGTQLPAVFLAARYGPEAAGWYLLADKLLTVPDALLGYSAKQVYLAQSAKLTGDGKAFQALFWSTVRKMLLLGFAAIGLMALVVPPLIPLLFGANWKESGVFLHMLSVLYLLRLIVNPIASNFYVLEAQANQIISEVIRFALIAFSMLAASIWIESAAKGVLCISVLSSLGYAVNGFFAWYVMKVRFKGGIGSLRRERRAERSKQG